MPRKPWLGKLKWIKLRWAGKLAKLPNRTNLETSVRCNAKGGHKSILNFASHRNLNFDPDAVAVVVDVVVVIVNVILIINLIGRDLKRPK